MSGRPFQRPTEEQCLAAIGLVEYSEGGDVKYVPRPNRMKAEPSSPPELIKAIQPDYKVFPRIHSPGRDDWLANHQEYGQSFAQFCRELSVPPDTVDNIIYILPLQFFEEAVPDDVLSSLTEFATYFFGMRVKTLAATAFADQVPHRRNEFTHNLQVHAGKILERMKPLKPGDAFCLAAITLCDLYPKEEWNFVFGLATRHGRVGVYSLARYMPGFFEKKKPSADMSPDEKAALLKRSCLLMCHEIGHMFNLSHCIYFHCLMNGSNNFEENDRKPLHLCPVCLRKLHLACKFDIVERYNNMHGFCQRNGMKKEADWYQHQLSRLDGSSSARSEAPMDTS